MNRRHLLASALAAVGARFWPLGEVAEPAAVRTPQEISAALNLAVNRWIQDNVDLIPLSPQQERFLHGEWPQGELLHLPNLLDMDA